jgi:hypothetical protein
MQNRVVGVARLLVGAVIGCSPPAGPSSQATPTPPVEKQSHVTSVSTAVAKLPAVQQGASAIPAPDAAMTDDERRLIGTWELVRVDNLREPPFVALPNLRFSFHPDRRIERTFASPSDAVSRFSVLDGKLQGQLGLSDDPAAVPLEWNGEAEVRISLPDGTFATLQRVAKEPGAKIATDFSCVPITMRGQYDPVQIDRLCKRMRESVPDPKLTALTRNTWSLDRGSDDPLLLRFDEVGTYVQGVDDVDEYVTSTRERYGYRLNGDVMRMQSEFGCSVLQLRAKGRALELSSDGLQWSILKVADARATKRLADMLPMSAKLSIQGDGYHMGGRTLTEAELEASAREMLADEPDQPFEVDVDVAGGVHPQRGEETKLLLQRAGIKHVEVYLPEE